MSARADSSQRPAGHDEGLGGEPLEVVLGQLREGQLRLERGLVATRRRVTVMVLLVLLTLGALAALYVDHMQRPPVVLEGGVVEADMDALVAEVDELQAQLRQSREERNRHLDESLRLRQRLLEQEQRVGDLTGGLDALAGRAARPAPEPPQISRASERAVAEHPSRPFNEALKASGIDDLALVEFGALVDGRLRDVLLAELDELGLPSVAAHYDRAWLQSRDGLVSLVLELQAPDEGPGVPPRLVPMPEVDLAAWREAGLAVGDVTTVADVRSALGQVLESQPYRVESLGGWDGDVLHDLVLSEHDEHGVEVARYHAGKAELLPVGPTLLLSEGSKVVGDSSRAFWQGRLRLVLPGASYGRFLDALAKGSGGRG